jgi:predicted RNA binding protein with dsRBD fold (UPF0201 family)
MTNIDNTFTMRRLLKKDSIDRNEFIELQTEFAKWLIKLNNIKRQKQILDQMRNAGVIKENEYDMLLMLCMSEVA